MIVGDHNGVIKILTPEIKSFGNPGENLSILNILNRNDKFLAFRVNGTIEEFDCNGNFIEIKRGTRKIIDGTDANGKEVVAFLDGSFEIDSTILKSSISNCKGISYYNNSLALCGNSNSEIWDINSSKIM